MSPACPVSEEWTLVSSSSNKQYLCWRNLWICCWQDDKSVVYFLRALSAWSSFQVHIADYSFVSSFSWLLVLVDICSSVQNLVISLLSYSDLQWPGLLRSHPLQRGAGMPQFALLVPNEVILSTTPCYPIAFSVSKQMEGIVFFCVQSLHWILKSEENDVSLWLRT